MVGGGVPRLRSSMIEPSIEREASEVEMPAWQKAVERVAEAVSADRGMSPITERAHASESETLRATERSISRLSRVTDAAEEPRSFSVSTEGGPRACSIQSSSSTPDGHGR